MHEKEGAVNAGRRKALVKALILLAFIALALIAVRFTPAQQYLTPEALSRFLGRAGGWAPLLFVLFYFTFFIGTVKEIWTSGHWLDLLSLRVFFALALFFFHS